MEDEEQSREPSTAITAEEIQRRVENWLERLRQLYEQINLWAGAHEWQASEVAPVLMDEELMQRFHVQPVQQPALRLEKSNGKYAFFKPKALWVIGANGRIDLYTTQGTFVVVDQAERFEDPKWTVFGIGGRRQGVPFTADLLS
jgi:hypothetical protein